MICSVEIQIKDGEYYYVSGILNITENHISISYDVDGINHKYSLEKQSEGHFLQEIYKTDHQEILTLHRLYPNSKSLIGYYKHTNEEGWYRIYWK